jgi:plastocyanin
MLPESGYLVAGTGHLHGGGVRLELTDGTCGRPLFTSEPSWAALGSDEYAIRPILHEPGPTHMSGFTASPGIPVAAGSVLRLTATYANDRPHTRVMGIMGVFLVPGPVEGCQPLPALALDPGTPGPPPRFVVPLPREPQGRLVKDPKRAVTVKEFSFSPERISLRRGKTLRWRFAGFLEHNVTVVSGPVGFSSQSMKAGVFSYRFSRPGVYKLFCSLHPAQMTQTVTVR